MRSILYGDPCLLKTDHWDIIGDAIVGATHFHCAIIRDTLHRNALEAVHEGKGNNITWLGLIAEIGTITESKMCLLDYYYYSHHTQSTDPFTFRRQPKCSCCRGKSKQSCEADLALAGRTYYMTMITAVSTLSIRIWLEMLRSAR